MGREAEGFGFRSPERGVVRKGRRGRERKERVIKRVCRGEEGLFTVSGGEERCVGGEEMGQVEGHY